MAPRPIDAGAIDRALEDRLAEDSGSRGARLRTHVRNAWRAILDHTPDSPVGAALRDAAMITLDPEDPAPADALLLEEIRTLFVAPEWRDEVLRHARFANRIRQIEGELLRAGLLPLGTLAASAIDERRAQADGARRMDPEQALNAYILHHSGDVPWSGDEAARLADEVVRSVGIATAGAAHQAWQAFGGGRYDPLAARAFCAALRADSQSHRSAEAAREAAAAALSGAGAPPGGAPVAVAASALGAGVRRLLAGTGQRLPSVRRVAERAAVLAAEGRSPSPEDVSRLCLEEAMPDCASLLRRAVENDIRDRDGLPFGVSCAPAGAGVEVLFGFGPPPQRVWSLRWGGGPDGGATVSGPVIAARRHVGAAADAEAAQDIAAAIGSRLDASAAAALSSVFSRPQGEVAAAAARAALAAVPARPARPVAPLPPAVRSGEASFVLAGRPAERSVPIAEPPAPPALPAVRAPRLDPLLAPPFRLAAEWEELHAKRRRLRQRARVTGTAAPS